MCNKKNPDKTYVQNNKSVVFSLSLEVCSQNCLFSFEGFHVQGLTRPRFQTPKTLGCWEFTECLFSSTASLQVYIKQNLLSRVVSDALGEETVVVVVAAVASL